MRVCLDYEATTLQTLHEIKFLNRTHNIFLLIHYARKPIEWYIFRETKPLVGSRAEYLTCITNRKSI